MKKLLAFVLVFVVTLLVVVLTPVVVLFFLPPHAVKASNPTNKDVAPSLIPFFLFILISPFI